MFIRCKNGTQAAALTIYDFGTGFLIVDLKGCQMKRVFVALAAVATFGFVSAASAADMPTKAPMAPLPVAYNWTGIYVGINGGGAWASESWTDNTAGPGTPVSIRPTGGVFGGQLGYRWQWTQLVLGLEGTWDWSTMRQTVSSGTIPAFTEELKVRSIWTATGQVGFAGIDRALLYVKGGWAGARSDANIVGAGFAGLTASNSQTSNGWTFGAGLDYAIWQNWIIGVEYDHFDLNFGTFTAPFASGGIPWIVNNTSRLRIDQVVGRLSYKFDWPH